MRRKQRFCRVHFVLLAAVLLFSMLSCRTGKKEGATYHPRSSTNQDVGTVEVLIHGLGRVKGNLLLRVVSERFSDEFPGVPMSAPEIAYILPVGKKGNTVKLPDLPYGRYSIALIHDTNRNGKLDTLLGFTPPSWLPLPSWPTEGYGFSCYKAGFFLKMKPGPTSFEESYFEVSSPETKVDLYMNYFWSRYGWTSIAFGIPVMMGYIANGTTDHSRTNRCAAREVAGE